MNAPQVTSERRLASPQVVRRTRPPVLPPRTNEKDLSNKEECDKRFEENTTQIFSLRHTKGARQASGHLRLALR